MVRKIKPHKVREPFRQEVTPSPVFWGLYVRLQRRFMGYSLENVAKDLHLSKGNLSEIENGLRFMKKETFNSFLSTYQLSFCEDLEPAEQAVSILNDLYDYNLRFDEPAIAEIEKNYKKVRNTFLETYAHFYALLIDYFLQVVIHLKPANALFEQLTLCEPAFAPDERALLYFIRGMEFRTLKRYALQEEAFKKALDFIDERLFFGLRPLIHYYQVQFMTRNANPFEAYVLCGQTRKAFYSMHNYIRALYLDNAEALCLMSCRQYPSALMRLQTILDNLHFVRDPFLRFCVVQNQILILSLMDEYDSALEIAREGKETFNAGGLESFSLCAYCLYMLGKEEEAMIAVRAMRPYTSRTEQRFLFRCIECAVLHPEHLEAAARRMLKYCQQLPNYEHMEITYKLLIRFYTMRSQSKKLLDIQTEYISFLNRSSS